MKQIIRKALKIQLVIVACVEIRQNLQNRDSPGCLMIKRKRAIPGVGQANIVHRSSIHQLHPFLPA